MAISTYDELQTAIQEWMDRTDIAGNVVDMITLAEARLNRKLKMVETNAPLTGVVGSREIDISGLSIIEPITLKLNDNFREWDLTPQPNGNIDYGDSSARPSMWSIDGTNIVFDVPLDQAYAFRFRYQGRFALSEAAPTNKLLEDNPDAYLAAGIVWGGLFTEDDRKIANWKGLLDEAISEISSIITQNKRAQLVVDPALGSIGRRNPNIWGWWV